MDNKKAGSLCWIALICWLLGHIGLVLLDLLERELPIPYDGYVAPVVGMLFVVGFILAIIARVTFPDSKFAKVLVEIFIVEVIMIIALIIFFLISCSLALKSCESDCIGCLNMG